MCVRSKLARGLGTGQTLRLAPEHPGKARREPREGTLPPHLQTHVRVLPCLPVLLGESQAAEHGVDRGGCSFRPGNGATLGMDQCLRLQHFPLVASTNPFDPDTLIRDEEVRASLCGTSAAAGSGGRSSHPV